MKVDVNNIVKKYDKTVLDGVSLTVEDGTICCLLGASGSGKTTLLRAIMGAIPVDSGDVSIDGIRVPDMKILKSLGFMPQQDAVYNELSVWDNLKFFAGIQGIGKKDFKEKAEHSLEVVGLSDSKRKLVRNCSGGMKKRLSLAGALIHNPQLLILDEPTVGIDPVLRRNIWNYLKELKQQGKTIIVTTHVMDEVNECDCAALIRGGRIVSQGTIEELVGMTENGKIEELFFLNGEAERMDV